MDARKQPPKAFAIAQDELGEGTCLWYLEPEPRFDEVSGLIGVVGDGPAP